MAREGSVTIIIESLLAPKVERSLIFSVPLSREKLTFLLFVSALCRSPFLIISSAASTLMSTDLISSKLSLFTVSYSAFGETKKEIPEITEAAEDCLVYRFHFTSTPPKAASALM